MDPINNPTPTPTPEPGAAPAPEPPVAPEAPVAPAPEPPVAEPAPVNAPVPPEPVNPVVNPGAEPIPANPVFQPSEPNGLAATDPIMQPEAPKAPDPVEEELKAPMKAAGPVPGSIGSAVSGPQSEGEAAPAPADNPFASAPAKTPSVPFNDPAAEAQGAAGAPTAKKPMDKKTLIILCVIAGIVVIALVVILLMMLGKPGSGGGSQSGSSNGGSEVVVNDDEEEDEDEIIDEGNGSDAPVVVDSGTMTCTKEIADEGISKDEEATSGTATISVEFADKILTTISLTKTSGTDASVSEKSEAVAADLTSDTALFYSLTTKDENGDLDLSIDAVKANYEDLDFVCEVL